MRFFNPKWGKHDRVLFVICFFPSIMVLILVFLIFVVFTNHAFPILRKEGISFFYSAKWWPDEDPSKCFYGILSALVGTLITSILAISISIPVTIAMIIAFNEVLPKRIGNALSTLVLVMSGLPTVIYGLWGIDTVIPFIKNVARCLGFETTGFSILSASIVLAIMITPYSFAIANEIYRYIPNTYREAIYSLGARTWQATRVLLSMARLGLIAATLLALGRAASETIVTTMLIGNTPSLTLNIFSSGTTIASLIATQFGEAYLYPYMESALYAAALVLFILGFMLSSIGLYLITMWRRQVYG